MAPRQERTLRLTLVNDLKLLFAALGAGGSVVPLGDNGRTARLLVRATPTSAPRTTEEPSSQSSFIWL